MKHIRYLNVVLTIIAVCLVLITLAVTGLLPTASAKEGPRYVAVPLNADGSINARLTGSAVMDVNISRVGGNEVLRKELPVNISQIRGNDVEDRVLPIDIKEVDGKPVRYAPLPVVTK